MADINNDGHLDVILGSYAYGQSVVVFAGNGDGSLQPAQPSGYRPVVDIQLTDVNGDGRLDVAAITNRDNGSDVLVFSGDGTGNFTLRDTYAECSEPFQILATDVNGDGKPDLIVGNAALEVLINTTQ
ncbi:MAG: VCBS repeat-containing protein [Acidobacteriales bacterium]|nr:VCBS repeat-containing protein [Terriglobales bacterium]